MTIVETVWNNGAQHHTVATLVPRAGSPAANHNHSQGKQGAASDVFAPGSLEDTGVSVTNDECVMTRSKGDDTQSRACAPTEKADSNRESTWKTSIQRRTFTETSRTPREPIFE